ncbi:hypothetical protein, partial [Alistipes senegalensis]|uniref:hypothetical protein n=1 Tax=Alistipes senegalensis TaxID=1288121 RepID=UPI00248E8010
MEKATRRETNVKRSEPTRRDFSLPPPGWSRRSGAKCNEAKQIKSQPIRMEKAMRRETNVKRSEPTRRDFSL